MDELIMKTLSRWFPGRVKFGQMSPPMKGWFISYVRVVGFSLDCHGCCFQGYPLEERVIKIRLPIWGFGYSINLDCEQWGQRVLGWYGRSGFHLGWIFE